MEIIVEYGCEHHDLLEGSGSKVIMGNLIGKLASW
jgi:hypothetical protein